MVDMGGAGGGVSSPSIQQYCLKWNNHPKNIATVFGRLRDDELFVDVTLATADRQVGGELTNLP